MQHSPFGIHIALSKYPMGNISSEKLYIDRLSDLYSRYKEKIKEYILLSGEKEKEVNEYLKFLYTPSIFHIYSHFDVAFISVIDNFKFPQRVFEPILKDDEILKSVSYQVLSGSIILNQQNEDFSWLFNSNEKFLKIIQLKINNGLLVGNGNLLYKECVNLIIKTFSNYGIKDYVLINSFNWGELLILCTHEDAGIIANALINLRKYTLSSITDKVSKKKIEEGSLYFKWNLNNIQNAHLFSETLSHLGVDFESYGNIENNKDFHTQIEWQIKPGHLPFFYKELENIGLIEQGKNYDNVFFKNGKTDYLIQEVDFKKLLSNQRIYKELRTNETLRSHLRKVKTKVLFDIDKKNLEYFNKLSSSTFNSPHKTEFYLAKFKIKNINKISEALRKLNVSRNTRKKVRKIIYNYNLGIQDPILSVYFIDLYNLIDRFIQDLVELSTKIYNVISKGELSKDLSIDSYGPLKTNYIETNYIIPHVRVFEEAFQDRILNNYNYEDLNEFSLDVNSSLTSIVSSFDTIIKFFSNWFREEIRSNNPNVKKSNYIITTINENATQSNRIDVNYNIEHLTNVPLVFATLIKEILNVDDIGNEKANNSNFIDLSREFNQLISEETSDENITFLTEILNNYNFAYFEIDYKKYHLTFLKDDKLYIFWHWLYPLQSTHLYSSVGYFDETNFIKELFRLLMVLRTEDYDFSKLECPIPELKTYWFKYFERIKYIVDKLCKTDSFNVIKTTLKKQIENAYKNIVDPDKTVDENVLSRLIERGIEAKLGHEIDTLSSLSIDDFCAKMYGKINLEPNLKPYDIFNILTLISNYNLFFIYNKFNGKNHLLRRDYKTGKPVEHFLKNSRAWYVDTFGGFFINNIEERQAYMNLNNKMLYLIWHISMVLKKEAFNPKINE